MSRAPQLELPPGGLAPSRPDRRPVLTDPDHVGWAAHALAGGAVVAHGFANLYAITTRADRETVRRVNALKGRPLEQVGSLTSPPDAVTEAWDLTRLPAGLSRGAVLEIVAAFFDLGPFGFRAPAAGHLPDHLTAPEGGTRTAQVIAPGYRCPSNAFLSRAARATGGDYLYITSANRSRHQTGADDSPAHWKAAGLLAEFGHFDDFVVLEHDNEDRARERYPHFLPVSTSILSLHRVARVAGDPRPHLLLERQGSLAASAVRDVLAGVGFGLLLDPRATRQLEPRSYLTRLCDR